MSGDQAEGIVTVSRENGGHDQVSSNSDTTVAVECAGTPRRRFRRKALSTNGDHRLCSKKKRRLSRNNNDISSSADPPNSTESPLSVAIAELGVASPDSANDASEAIIRMGGGQSDSSPLLLLSSESYGSCGSVAMSLSPASSLLDDEHEGSGGSISESIKDIYTRPYGAKPDDDGVLYPDHHHSLILDAAAKMVHQKREPAGEDTQTIDLTNFKPRFETKEIKETDDEDRKIFIGGLSFDTSEYDLEHYFSRYGMVVLVNLKYDCVTGISRGFAFVSFAEEESVNEVMRKPIHIIHGRYIEARRAKSRPVFKKIFVGGIDGSLTENDIRTYFTRFGQVNDIDIPVDRARNLRRNFCFLYFDTEEAADDAAMWPRQMIKSKLVDVRKTLPQPLFRQQKRIAQAAGLDLNEFDCNYKFSKLMNTARMVSASAALATQGLATPLSGYFPDVPTAVPGGPQVSVAANGAIIPYQDHIKSASMAAVAVANAPHAYPAAKHFANNCMNAAYGMPYAPSAGYNYHHPLLQAYMTQHPGHYSMPNYGQEGELDTDVATAALTACAMGLSPAYNYGNSMPVSNQISNVSHTSSLATSAAYYARLTSLAPPPPPPPAPSSAVTPTSGSISSPSIIPKNATAQAAAIASRATIVAAAFSYTTNNSNTTNGKA